MDFYPSLSEDEPWASVDHAVQEQSGAKGWREGPFGQ